MTGALKTLEHNWVSVGWGSDMRDFQGPRICSSASDYGYIIVSVLLPPTSYFHHVSKGSHLMVPGSEEVNLSPPPPGG